MLQPQIESYEKWEAYLKGVQETPPCVVFFERKPPHELVESGLYISFVDFLDVRREMDVADVPLTGWYHTLVLHQSRDWPTMHQQANKHLRYNPNNHSCYNENSWTRSYHLYGSALIRYSTELVEPKNKIVGFGEKGRRILRAVLFEDFENEIYYA
ncbi:MAG: hypothetical protein AAB459_02335 [Patescibacteria group bacterium]